MSDMLLEENRVREEKKQAINDASRKYGEVLSNAPLGEHEPAKTAALKFADDAANYMRIQDQLLKSGQLKLRDYTINRQNLLDGTNNAFTALKEFQDTYAQKMERARTSKSALFELRKMEQVQGFGNWRESGFYINPSNGSVNIAMMTQKDINGQKVFTMDDQPGKFATTNYVRGLIQGEWNRYNYNEAADGFVSAMGKQIEAVQTAYADLKQQGVVTSINDIRTKKEIDPVTKQILYSIDMAEDQAITAALANDFDRASLLTDSKKTAPNGKLYDFTQDEKKAAANPNLILEVIDPNTGRSTLKFTNQQIKDSDEFLRTEFKRRYDYEKKIDVGGQLQPQPQPRERSPYEIANAKEIADAKNFAENLSMALTGKDDASVKNAAKYLANKAGKLVDKNGSIFTVSNADGSNSTSFDLKGDPKKLAKSIVSAFGTQLPEDKIAQFTIGFMGANPFDTKFNASGFNPKPAKTNTVQAYNEQVDNLIGKNPTAYRQSDKDAFASELNKVAGKFGYTVKTSFGRDRVYLVDKDGNESKVTFEVTDSQKKNGETLRKIADFIKSDLAGASPEEKEANAASKLQTLGVTKPGGVGAKYN
jgi:hypothetical protein